MFGSRIHTVCAVQHQSIQQCAQKFKDTGIGNKGVGEGNYTPDEPLANSNLAIYTRHLVEWISVQYRALFVRRMRARTTLLLMLRLDKGDNW